MRPNRNNLSRPIILRLLQNLRFPKLNHVSQIWTDKPPGAGRPKHPRPAQPSPPKAQFNPNLVNNRAVRSRERPSGGLRLLCIHVTLRINPLRTPLPTGGRAKTSRLSDCRGNLADCCLATCWWPTSCESSLSAIFIPDRQCGEGELLRGGPVGRQIRVTRRV